MADDRTGPGPGEYLDPGDQPEPENETAALRAQVAELEDRWRRTAAELDNLRKRLARDAERQRWDERGRVAAAWLPVVDNLDLALKHADADPPSIVSGVRAVRDQALAVLAALGYPRREDRGAAFDPARHEAVATRVDNQAEPGTVVDVMRPGYGDGDRQLRPAEVVVATRSQETDRERTDGGADGS